MSKTQRLQPIDNQDKEQQDKEQQDIGKEPDPTNSEDLLEHI